MRKKISNKELLKLTDEEKCRVLVEIILGKLEYWEE